jgi:hypothetical protein
MLYDPNEHHGAKTPVEIPADVIAKIKEIENKK